MRARPLRAALLAGWLAAAAAAQDAAPRGKFAGFVRGIDGKRVAAADVTLLSRPVPDRPDLGAADELHVRTGADGMFRVELLHGRAYSAWATWRDEAGSDRRTRVLDGAIPGPPMPLEEAARQGLRSIRLVGVEAWQDRAPLRVTVTTSAENVAVVPLQLDERMRASIPTLPGDWCSIEVRGADGMELGSRAFTLADGKLVDATLELAAPRTLRIVVADEKGAPLAGALVHHALAERQAARLNELGRTGPEGWLQGTVPAAGPPRGDPGNAAFLLLVEAPGRQRVLQWHDKVEGELRVVLPPGCELRGRVLGKDGAPPRGLVLLPDCYAATAGGGMGVPLHPAVVDGDGRFSFSSLHPKYDFRLLALLEPRAAIEAGLRLRLDVAVAPVLWLATGKPPFASPHDLGELRLDTIPVVQVAVQTHAGEPVPGARLAITTRDLYVSPLHYVCDRVGRLQFPLPAGEIRIGAWAPGGGVATRLVRVPAAPGDASIDPLVLTLSATRSVRGIVVDGNGKPVAGAVVYQWNRAKTADRELAELTFHGRTRSEPTGADGAFTLVLPMDDAPFGLRAGVSASTPPMWSEEIVTSPGDLDADRLRLVVAPLPPEPAKTK